MTGSLLVCQQENRFMSTYSHSGKKKLTLGTTRIKNEKTK